MSRIIQVHQLFHLGDNIINFIFFHKIKDYIEQNDIIIHYHCHEQYHKNLHDFNCSENIKILPCEPDKIYGYNLHLQNGVANDRFIEDRLCNAFNIFLNNHNIPISVDLFEYEDLDLFKRFEELEDKYKKIDILVINSQPLSGQYHQYYTNKNDWNDYCIKLSEKYTIATTEQVNHNILCLDTFSVKNIAAIALNVKKIIAINTGPSIALYNKNILDNIEDFYLFGYCHNFKTRKIKCLSNIQELDSYIEYTSENENDIKI
jgi:hypothetical protein